MSAFLFVIGWLGFVSGLLLFVRSTSAVQETVCALVLLCGVCSLVGASVLSRLDRLIARKERQPPEQPAPPNEHEAQPSVYDGGASWLPVILLIALVAIIGAVVIVAHPKL